MMDPGHGLNSQGPLVSGGLNPYAPPLSIFGARVGVSPSVPATGGVVLTDSAPAGVVTSDNRKAEIP